MKKSLQISKLDAAKRQLETAIRIYFFDGDPVALHTLTAAGYNVIRDINTKRSGERMMIKDQIFDYIKPEFKEMFRLKLNEAENFFKHADRDHDATLDFNPKLTELFLLDACSQYYKLTGEFPPLFRVYQMWFMVNNQSVFNFPKEQVAILRMNTAEMVTMGKQGFFNVALLLLMKSGI